MDIKTFTKKDIAIQISKRNGISIRLALKLADDFFLVLRDYLCKDDPYVRIEIRNFGVFESKPTKAKPRARNPKLMKRFMSRLTKKHVLSLENY